MPDPHSDTARRLSKLISAIRKQWQEALGEPDAAAAEAALRNAHRLLSAIGKHTVAETRRASQSNSSWAPPGFAPIRGPGRISPTLPPILNGPVRVSSRPPNPAEDSQAFSTHHWLQP
jgi:hypothetical protein